MKITGGFAKGKNLKSHKYIRPTQGIIKKIIFDVLSEIEGKTAIDIFAGIGSIGMEALSRGAKRVLFVEKDRYAASIIRHNLRSLKFEKSGDVFAMDALRALGVLKKKGFIFDIFFADPPYNYRGTPGFLERLFSSEILADGAKGAVEHSRNIVLKDYGPFKKRKEKRCGETMLTFYERACM